MSFTRTLRAVGGAAMAGALLLGTAPAASADQVRDNQWPLQAFKADEIWKISTGQGVTVGLIDSGVDANHPDLKRNIVKGKDLIDGGDPAPEDEDETHGTSMAGIIAGHGHGPGGADGVKGLAPEAKIMPIRDNGTRQQGFLPAIRYAVDHGASVINISEGRTTALEDRKAIAYAWKHDVLIVAASGNNGNGPEEKVTPASYPGVLAVGGVTNTGQIWEKSNYGPWVMLTAPGTHITSTGLTSSSPPYGSANGTSGATAYVSATAALLRAKYPDLTAGQIANRMVKTAGLPASAKGLKLPDERYGYGFVQPLAALKADIPAGPKSGPLKTPDLVVKEAKAAAQAKKARDANKKEDLRPLAAGLGVVVLLVIVAVVIILVRRKNNSGGPPPGNDGWGGPGGASGYPPQHPGPYQQQPAPPGGQYPSGPPNQPPSGW